MTDIGDYRVMGKLGEGTFSEVLRVRNRRTGKYFAMKRFKKHFKGVDEIECLREIQALRRLNHHPNIIQLEEVIFDAKYGVLSLAFELMDANLYEVLSKKGSPPVHESRSKWMMWQIMKAMDFVHSKGIFHRDIKPENILVRGDVHGVTIPFPSADPSSTFHHSSSFPLIKLADLGSCRGVHSAPPFTEYIATRWYRSPECLMFDGVYGYKMDLWGLGCVFFELITKIPLFPGDDEMDQLHKIHNVLGTPAERLLKIMVMAGQQAIANGKAEKETAAAAVINEHDNLTTTSAVTQRAPRGIFKRPYQFAPTKGCGLRAAFPPHILYGAHRVPPKTAASQPGYQPSDYPGITDECVNLIELLLQYDPEARPSARQTLKHPWLKECRDIENMEKQAQKEQQQVFQLQQPISEIAKTASMGQPSRKVEVPPKVVSNVQAAALSPTDSWTKSGRKSTLAEMSSKLAALSNPHRIEVQLNAARPSIVARAPINAAKVLAPISNKSTLSSQTTTTPTRNVQNKFGVSNNVLRGVVPSTFANQSSSALPRLGALGEPTLTIKRTGSIKKPATQTLPRPPRQIVPVIEPVVHSTGNIRLNPFDVQAKSSGNVNMYSTSEAILISQSILPQPDSLGDALKILDGPRMSQGNTNTIMATAEITADSVDQSMHQALRQLSLSKSGEAEIVKHHLDGVSDFSIQSREESKNNFSLSSTVPPSLTSTGDSYVSSGHLHILTSSEALPQNV